jgi:lysophospholipase L1-like esterase
VEGLGEFTLPDACVRSPVQVKWACMLRSFLLLLAAAPSLSSLAEAPPENTAIIPAGRLEKDFYDWDQRHAAVMAVKATLKPEIVLIGDSITHMWGGPPEEKSGRGNRGLEAWKSVFGDRPVLNLGFGWDRTQNVLKRIELGELDGLAPKAVVILIGTNNLAGTKNARENTPAEIAEAIGVIVDKVQAKCPKAQIILTDVFPRGEKPDNPYRAKIAEINKGLTKLGGKPRVTVLDLTSKFTNADGTISKDVMSDFLHPTAKGYAIWAEALRAVLPK